MSYNYFGMDLSLADVIGLFLGALSTLFTPIVLFFLLRSSKVLGGLLGKAFRQIIIGVIFLIFSVIFLGFAFGPMNLRESVIVAFVGPISWFIGNLFILDGALDIIKITKLK